MVVTCDRGWCESVTFTRPSLTQARHRDGVALDGGSFIFLLYHPYVSGHVDGGNCCNMRSAVINIIRNHWDSNLYSPLHDFMHPNTKAKVANFRSWMNFFIRLWWKFRKWVINVRVAVNKKIATDMWRWLLLVYRLNLLASLADPPPPPPHHPHQLGLRPAASPSSILYNLIIRFNYTRSFCSSIRLTGVGIGKCIIISVSELANQWMSDPFEFYISRKRAKATEFADNAIIKDTIMRLK